MLSLDEVAALFRFGVAPLELVLRGTAVYWFLFGLFRFVLRRDAGSIGIADILLLVIVADAAQNAMSGGYETVADGFVLVATICGWNWLMDWAGYRFRVLHRFFEPAPVVLVRRGRLVRAALRRELISVPELMGRLREHGVDKLAEVKMARMESDGDISVLRYADADDASASPPRGAGRA